MMPDFTERTLIAQSPITILLLMTPGEEADADKILSDWNAFLGSLNREYEILSVDAGGGQRTCELAQSLAMQYPRLRVVDSAEKNSVGVALRTGLTMAQYPLLFYSEWNGRYQIAELQALLDTIDQVDLVTGYRTPRSQRSWKEYAFGWIARWAFGVHCKDPECSFKLFRRSIFERIPIQSEGEFVHSEILAKANFLGCLMTEVPISYRPSADTKTDGSALGQKWREAYRMLRAPDFGPPQIQQAPPG